jgi:signal transduction histidine kinase
MQDTPQSRLLVVDDEKRLMVALCNTLRDEGYDVTGVSSGAEALKKIAPGQFDVMLTDLMMPEMDGITLLRAAFERDPQIVGIVMTAHGTISTAVEAMKAGAMDYVLKPFALSSLLPVLDRALTVRRLRAKNLELENRVYERTAELEKANRELEAFSYSISHDLRAPLRTISGFSEVLLQDYLPDLPKDAQHLVQRIMGSAQRMEALIAALLDFARFSRQALNKRPVNTAELVADVVEELRKGETERQIDVQIAPLPVCSADPALLRQVFVNLLSNAFKFTRTRDRAQIGVDCAERDGNYVFSVRDNGVGFDPAHAENLFGVFQRMHPVDKFEGTGVGLSIVQRIVERHGGRIWAEAKYEAGATFHFTIPKEPAKG